MLSTPSLHLLGPLIVECASGPVSLRYNKARALLAYLVLERGYHTRESLAYLLWPDDSPQVGRENLRRMLFLIKECLPDLIESSREVLHVRPGAALWIDAERFVKLIDVEERAVAAGRQVDLGGLAQAASLHRGEFLQGMDVGDAPDFDDWMRLRREQYHRRYLRALELLVEGHEHAADLDSAIDRALAWTQAAPLDEAGWHHLLRLLVKSGQAGRATSEFERYRRVLGQELGTAPAPATEALLNGGHDVDGQQDQAATVRCMFSVAGNAEVTAEPLQRLAEACEAVLRNAGARVVRLPDGSVAAYFNGH